ncbi:hypothetical protein [Nocardiopsis ansamitocini]|uniref:hypothetical protein n=1 Tax=Nocardiopsis ansamitocini TaxID=1670832 RepID=UPI002552D2C6|nr:hypothetical protein [Nocardiopsis ansamitocini]
MRAIVENPETASGDFATQLEDVVLTARQGYLIAAITRVPGGDRGFLLLRLERDTGNLALAQRALGRLVRGVTAVAEAEAAPVLPRRCNDVQRLAHSPVRDRTRPDAHTLHRVLGALKRSLYAPPVSQRGTRLGVRAEAT